MLLWGLCVFLLLLLSSLESLAWLRTSSGPRRWATTLTSTASTTSRQASVGELQRVLEDVVRVVTETGVGPVGARSFQVAKALNTVTREFLSNQSAFASDDGSKLLSPPKLLRRLFEELGSTYIKLGQFIASSPTLFPADYVLEFQACLDKSPTIPFSEVRQIIQTDLGRPLSVVFEYVDPRPLASASIAQVHRARLRNSTEVVVKVQKPNAEGVLKADLGFLLVASKIVELINPSLSRLSLSNIVGDIRASMLDELDFRKEAANLDNFRAFLDRSGVDEAVAPQPYPEASSKRVLTMDFLKGVPLVDLEGIRRYSSNPERTLIVALNTWAASVVQNDIFHADVHGGNLLVLEDGRVGFIDFGIVGRISPTVWNSLGLLVESFVAGDFQGVARALVGMGAAEQTVDVDKFGRELQVVIDRISSLQPELLVSTASTLDGQVVSADVQFSVDERETTQIVLEIVAVAENNGLKLPREFGLLLKQALYFDRYQKLLAPSLDPLRDPRVRGSLAESGELFAAREGRGPGSGRIIDAEIVQ